MKTFIQDGHTLVLRVVRKLSGAETGWDVSGEGLRLVLEDVASRDWASLTFTGQLHRIEFRLEGPVSAVEAAVERVADGIADIDAGSDRYFIAEAAITDSRIAAVGPHAAARLTVEALVLEA